MENTKTTESYELTLSTIILSILVPLFGWITVASLSIHNEYEASKKLVLTMLITHTIIGFLSFCVFLMATNPDIAYVVEGYTDALKYLFSGLK